MIAADYFEHVPDDEVKDWHIAFGATEAEAELLALLDEKNAEIDELKRKLAQANKEAGLWQQSANEMLVACSMREMQFLAAIMQYQKFIQDYIGRR